MSIEKTNRKTKPIFKLLNWSKFSGTEQIFCFIIWSWITMNKLQTILSSDFRKKIMILWLMKKTFFNQQGRNSLRTNDIIKKAATGQGDDYTSNCLLDYNYFKNYHKMRATDLSKQQALDADPKAIQQISFTGNLNRAEGATMFFIIKEAKETISDFSQGTLRILWMLPYDLATACSTVYFCFNIISV